jgi:hypothetical protein
VLGAAQHLILDGKSLCNLEVIGRCCGAAWSDR